MTLELCALYLVITRATLIVIVAIGHYTVATDIMSPSNAYRIVGSSATKLVHLKDISDEEVG